MLLFEVVYAHRASGSHHKIAMDALRRLARPDAEDWRKLFCLHADAYMKGAKAPDDVFRDSQNHVLHVRDNYWGGALESAEAWYAKLVELLRAKDWPAAVYAAGVLSHYVCDPMQPLHTAQSEAEGAIHRAFEQSVAKSYGKLLDLVEARGWPAIEVEGTPDWLRALVRSGAEAGVVHYEACIDHYDLDRGVKSPPDGLDAHLKDVMAGQLARAIVGFALVMERALEEAAVPAPQVDVTVQGYLAMLDIPVQWVLRKMEDMAERAVVEKMYAEYQQTGKVVKTLAADDKIVRSAHAMEVLKTPLVTLDAQPARKPGTLHGYRPLAAPVAAPLVAPTQPPVPLIPVDHLGAEPVPPPAPEPVVEHAAEPAPDAAPAPRKRRTRASAIVDAPAIGEKIAARLEAIGIHTIGDLLDANVADVAEKLAQKWATPETVTDWQAMAQLAVDVETVGEQDAQILIACGVRDRTTLAARDARALQGELEAFVASDAGKRMLRGAGGPKPEKIERWIEAAKGAA